MKKRLLSVAVIVTFLFGTFAYAKEYEPVQEEAMAVVDAEDIGISPIQNIEEDEIGEDVLEEPEEDFEESEETESEEVPEAENPEEDEDYEEETVSPEEDEDYEEETVSPEPPAGMVEGYVEGVYFYPNENDCEIREECYKCEDDGHIYAHSVCMDDRGYVLDEWCTICGHGTSKRITDEEFEALGVECDVEF